MGIKHDLNRSINIVLGRNRTGSYATQTNRRHLLSQFANDLVTLGYGLRDIRNLKQKHIFAVIEHWQKERLSNATLKNRTASLRALCRLIDKPSIIPSNDQLNIGKRTYVAQTNKAIFRPALESINNKHVRISLELQRLFGLRREESLKIKPHVADKGDKLQLLPTWCKGGRGREIPIRTEEQRYWLEQAKQVAEKFGQSLIPQEKNYIQQRYVYDKQIARAGLKKLHGLRHAYAQNRYKELTGWDAPINGGPKARDLTKEQRALDYQARMILTEELGHSREQITVNYLGR